jgi:hypothetical protein
MLQRHLFFILSRRVSAFRGLVGIKAAQLKYSVLLKNIVRLSGSRSLAEMRLDALFKTISNIPPIPQIPVQTKTYTHIFILPLGRGDKKHGSFMHIAVQIVHPK